MTRAHDTVVVDRLNTDKLANIVFYDDPPPRKNGEDLLKRYLLLRTGTGYITADRLTGPSGPRTKTYYLTGVGSSPMQAAWVLEQATEMLLNWTPTVPGWSCRRMTPAASQAVFEDPDVDGRFFGVDQWDLFTSPHA